MTHGLTRGVDLLYRFAGRGAQAGVQASIALWRTLPQSVQRKRVLLWWLLGPDGTPPYKMSKPDSGYVMNTSSSRKCANCMSLYLHVESWDRTEAGPCPKGTYICDQVRGVVRPQDTCTEKWSPVRSAAFYRRYQDPEKLKASRGGQ